MIFRQHLVAANGRQNEGQWGEPLEEGEGGRNGCYK